MTEPEMEAAQSETAEIIRLEDEAKRRRVAQIETLKTQRAKIDADLITLGVKRVRKASATKRGPGRPKGSRSRVVVLPVAKDEEVNHDAD